MSLYTEGLKALLSLNAGLWGGDLIVNPLGRGLGNLGHRIADVPRSVGEGIGQTYLVKCTLDGIDFFLPEASWWVTALKCGLVFAAVSDIAILGSQRPYRHNFFLKARATGKIFGLVASLGLSYFGAIPSLIGGGLISFGLSYFVVHEFERFAQRVPA